MSLCRDEIAVGVRRDAIGAAAVTGEIEASVIETMSLEGLDGADGDAGVDGFLMRVPAGEEWATIDRLLDGSGGGVRAAELVSCTRPVLRMTLPRRRRRST